MPRPAAEPASAVEVVPWRAAELHILLNQWMHQSWAHHNRADALRWLWGRGRYHTVAVLGWGSSSPAATGVHHQSRMDLGQKGVLCD